jgi:toxin FitB
LKFLIDADDLSEPTKPEPATRLIEWSRAIERGLAVDPIVLGEVRLGIPMLPVESGETGSSDGWFDDGVGRSHCVAWEAATGLRWAALLASLRETGQVMPIKDSLVAGALTPDFRVVTRNVADFFKAKVRVVDPFVA